MTLEGCPEYQYNGFGRANYNTNTLVLLRKGKYIDLFYALMHEHENLFILPLDTYHNRNTLELYEANFKEQ